MYHVTVRSRMMVAHSFAGATFGPAQNLHGATYVVDVTFYRRELDADGVVVDIGAAAEALDAVLREFNFRNLDEIAALKGHNTTTEFMAGTIFARLHDAIRAAKLGAGAKELTRMQVRLAESDVAWAGYEAEL